MLIRRIMVTTTMALSVGTGVQAVGMQGAAAEASGHASCVGIEFSAISPPATSDEFPGGGSELAHLVGSLAQQFGVTPGAIVAPVARLHEGSHLACDEASE
ncbi:MAG: hypothetical protein ABR549_15580 [Mycobacteriales bacterium]